MFKTFPNNRRIVVFDFETTGRYVWKFERGEGTEPIQIGAVAVHPRSLKILDEFCELMRPLREDLIDQEALNVNHKTIEELRNARSPDAVWADFVSWVNKHNVTSTGFGRPIPCGYNIRGFDMRIVQRLCTLYGPTDKNSGEQAIFSSFNMIDLADDIFRFWENSGELPNQKLDTVRQHVGISTENKHDALLDCRDTALILQKFMRLYRYLLPKIPFKDSMATAEAVG